MNIVIDYGNTTAKVGIFSNGKLDQKLVFGEAAALKKFLEGNRTDNLLVSSVSFPASEVLSWSSCKGKKVELTYKLPLPVKILYKTPATLGVDRIASVCGALELFPGRDCLVIDAGTCITFELLDAAGNYHGGSISPGVNMRFEAMHQGTSRLPKVTPAHPVHLVGDSTETSMQSGVINGIRAEVDGIIAEYQKRFRGLVCLLCGGDLPYFENPLNPAIQVSPDLVLIGLHRILKNVSEK